MSGVQHPDGSLNVSIVNADVTLDADIVLGSVSIVDGSNTLGVNSDGSIDATVQGSVSVINSVLPSGAATSSAQTSAQTSLSSIVTNTAAAASSLGNPLSVTGAFYPATQPISAASLPLPSLAATSTLQSTINTTLGSPFQAGGSIGNSSFGISGTLPAFTSTPTVNLGTLNGAATAGNQATEIASLANLDVALSTRLKAADTLAAVTTVGTITNPVAVTGTFYQTTQPVSAASLPLPANAAKETSGNLAVIASNTNVLAAGISISEDSVIGCLNTIVGLLTAIDYRLRELPLNLTVALNQTLNASAGPIRFTLNDNLEDFEFDAANRLNN